MYHSDTKKISIAIKLILFPNRRWLEEIQELFLGNIRERNEFLNRGKTIDCIICFKDRHNYVKKCTTYIGIIGE
jgi:hypothetical protein